MEMGLVANIFISEDWEEACKITSRAGLKKIEFASGGFDLDGVGVINRLVSTDNISSPVLQPLLSFLRKPDHIFSAHP